MDLTEEKARSGHTGDGVRAMLGWSLLLGFTGLIVALVSFVR